ncbi:MAG: hypothetical protein EAZ97_15020 [Bacteroidetes bacterium]|nr:MAG: hypothetical protein EAZ97_15020 [Bacteroidota bacterium]
MADFINFLLNLAKPIQFMKQNLSFLAIFCLALLLFLLSNLVFNHLEPQKISNQEILPMPILKDSTESAEISTDSTIVLADSISPLKQLEQTLSELDTAEALIHGAWGFCLSNTKTGEIIAQRNPKQSLVPASVMKMINTGVALQKAGKDYHFKTFLQIDGELDSINRILKGNIYIKGGGDPTLGSRVYSGLAKEKIMNWWLDAIKKLKIDSVQGAIIADARFYEYEMIPAGWTWEDLQTDYGVGASGLSFCENTLELTINNGNIVETSPNLPYLQLINQIATH